MATLTTKRLVLREFRPEDWRDVYDWCSDPEVLRFVGEPQGESQVRDDVQRRSRSGHPTGDRGEYIFAIQLMEGGKVIGDCQLHCGGHPMYHPRLGDVCYCLNRAYWGQGYATEVVSALLAFAFDKLKLHRVTCKMITDNAASARVAEKAGMRREGHLLREALVRGTWYDEYLYAMLEDEWTGLKL